MRYFIRLAYNGANYHGWQSQPNAESVQETVEKALSMVLRKQISITGAGRTDAGVNASVMIAHFDVDEAIVDIKTLIMRLNSIVGRDISVYNVFRVHDDAHARLTPQHVLINISFIPINLRSYICLVGVLHVDWILMK